MFDNVRGSRRFLSCAGGGRGLSLCYLLFEQWQRPPEAAYLPPATSEWAWPWHFFLEEDESGGLPAEAAGATRGRRDEPCLPFETLPSPVIDERKEELADESGAEMLKLSLEY